MNNQYNANYYNTSYQRNQSVQVVSNPNYQQHYSQAPMNSNFMVKGQQQQYYGMSPIKQIQGAPNQTYMMSQHSQKIAIPQSTNFQYQSKKTNLVVNQQYVQQQNMQYPQQMYRNGPMPQNQGMNQNAMYLQNRTLTPEQIALQQRLQQQQQLQLQRQQAAQRAAVREPPVKEPAIQCLDVPDHYFNTPRQKEQREANSFVFYPYEVVNDLNKLNRENHVCILFFIFYLQEYGSSISRHLHEIACQVPN